MAVLVPKVFHRIWLGPRSMPEEFRAFGDTWLRNHPGWEMRLWTDANRPELRHESRFLATSNWSNKSNLLRYELMLDIGGVYIDTDFECYRPIGDLVNDIEFFTACEHEGVGWIAPGFFGAVPGHAICAELVREIPNCPDPLDHPLYCATRFFTSVVKRHPEAKVFPPALFYPYYCDELHRRHESFPDAYAAHHWAMSWKENSL